MKMSTFSTFKKEQFLRKVYAEIRYVKTPRRQESTKFMYGFMIGQIMSGTQKLSQNNTPETFNRNLEAIFDP